MKIVYMGTPDFAVGALERLIEDGHEVALVVTNPDKPKGRSGKMVFSPVKECAVAHNIEVMQPTKVRLPEYVDKLKEYNADVFVVCAFGQILSKEILDMPRLGCINIHASLLPKYRGAAPIQWSILNGDEKTGVTIMQMDEGLDTGNMIIQKEIEIAPDETGESLFDKLSMLGADMISEVLAKEPSGDRYESTPQGEGDGFYARMLTKEDGLIDWEKPGKEIGNYIRGLYSWPGAYTFLDGVRTKVLKAKFVEGEIGGYNHGEICAIDKNTFSVKVEGGSIEIDYLQYEGKKAMSTHDFMLGRKLSLGQKLG
jgi:methionyl-tRNA formyltransferase